jgi:hypothetical protein
MTGWRRRARLRVGRGIVAGVPDLFVLHRGVAHMIEIKTQAGELSDPQWSVMAAVLASGGRVGVVRATPTRCWGYPMHGAFLGRSAWWCGEYRGVQW